MNNLPEKDTSSSDFNSLFSPGTANVKLIYILYLLSVVLGITVLVGLVLAYMNRSQAEAWVQTHYTWAIRTFWIGLLFGFISALLLVIGVGFLLFLLLTVWMVVRVVIGLKAVAENKPIQKPTSWLI